MLLAMEISKERRTEIRGIADFILENKIKNLLFVCTHNSRRSQFCQVAFSAASQGLGYGSYSAGTEVTRVYNSVVSTLKGIGFGIIEESGEDNPKITLTQEPDETELCTLWSKTWDDPSIEMEDTLAIMTCSDAEENCPYIPFAKGRIPLRYEDPKYSDGTAEEPEVYKNKFNEIYAEIKLLVDMIA